MTDWLNWSICSVCSTQRFASLLTRGPWKAHNGGLQYLIITESLSRPHTRMCTHTRTHNCPLMQRECVSKDKAISRSEYRQTEGIVFHVDTQAAANTHPHPPTQKQWQKICSYFLSEPITTPKDEVQINHTQKENEGPKKGLQDIFLKVSDFQGSWTDERHQLLHLPTCIATHAQTLQTSGKKSTTRQAKQLHPPTRETILSHLHPFPLLVPLHLPHSPFCAAPSVHVLSHRGSQTWRSGCTWLFGESLQNSARFILTLQTLMVPSRSAEQNNIISRNKRHKSSNSSRVFLPKPRLARENPLLKVTSKRNRKGCYLYV